MKRFEYTYDEAFWKINLGGLTGFFYQPKRVLLEIDASGEKHYVRGDKAEDFYERLKKQTADMVMFSYTHNETECHHVASKFAYSVFVPGSSKYKDKFEFKIGGKYAIRGVRAKEFYDRLLNVLDKLE